MRKIRKTKRTIQRRASARPSAPVRLFRSAKNALLYLAKHPAQAGAPVLFLTIALFAFLYTALTNRIFISDIEISADITERSFSASTLVEAAISRLPDVALDRLQQLPTYGARLGDIVTRPSEKYESDRICHVSIKFGLSDEQLLVTGVRRAVMSSAAFDNIITENVISIRRAAFSLRELFGWNAREIKTRLYRKGRKFEISARASPAVVDVRTAEFERIEDAEKILAKLLLDFLAPEVLTLEQVHKGESNFVSAVRIAEAFLADKQKALFVKSLAIGSWLEHSRDINNAHAYVALADLSKVLLDETDFSIYGSQGALLKLRYASRVAQAELNRTDPYDREKRLTLFRSWLEPHTKDLNDSVEHQVELAAAELEYGLVSSFQSRMGRILQRNIAQETSGLTSNAETLAAIVLALARNPGIATPQPILISVAQSIFDANETNASQFYADRRASALLSMAKSVLKTYQGDSASLLRLSGQAFGGDVCLEQLAVRSLENLLRSDDLTARRTDIIRAMLDGYMRAEKQGIKSFEFYNKWGILEFESKNYVQASKRYETALRFEGVHEWALLNWGLSALRAGNLAVARSKYEESLRLAPVPNAAWGLLEALFSQKDTKGYLDAYLRYPEQIAVLGYEERSMIERNALMAACTLKQPAPLSVLRDGEQIEVGGRKFGRDDFNFANCRFPQ